MLANSEYSKSYSYENYSYNSFGQIGLIQTPSANTKPEGTVSLILNRNDIWKFGTLSVSPFDWLEAGYFYYRPSDLIWEGNLVRGHYLDKGFNVKFAYKNKNNLFPNIAIGLDDFAGTGFFSREYIVSSKQIQNFNVSLGIGWGKYVGENSFKNPLSSLISEKFTTRPLISDNYKSGGTPGYDKWFRGRSSFFGGLEYLIPNSKGLKLKIERDPFDYLNFSANNRSDAIYEIRQKDSKINYGLSYSLNDFVTLDASYIKGNTFNINFVFGATFNEKLFKKQKFSPKIVKKENTPKTKKQFYEDLLYNLNNNGLLLQTSTISNSGELDIAISTSDHINALRSSSYAAKISKNIAKLNDIPLNHINVSHINVGIELNEISYISEYLDENNKTPAELIKRNTKFKEGSPKGYLENEFRPSVKFPAIFFSTSPTLVSHIGNPEKFYYGGINLQNISEIQFSRSLILSSEIVYPLINDFKDSIAGPGSNMQHVRTDLIQYLKEDDLFLNRMQLDYIWSPVKQVYAKVTAGILESMYAGLGGEILYKPFNRNFSIGADLFYVKQRSFEKRFNFQDYKTTTGHINFGYNFPLGIESNLSFGRYLAKDDGFTLDLAKKTKTGFKAGIYFTRTNVSSELFGEGSFDKGFYVQVPLDFFTSNYTSNYSTFKLSPLTRDGGAKLIHDKDLKGIIYNSSYYELNNQWNGFNN